MRLIVGIALLALAAPVWAQESINGDPFTLQGAGPWALAAAGDGSFTVTETSVSSSAEGCSTGQAYAADGTSQGEPFALGPSGSNTCAAITLSDVAYGFPSNRAGSRAVIWNEQSWPEGSEVRVRFTGEFGDEKEVSVFRDSVSNIVAAVAVAPQFSRVFLAAWMQDEAGGRRIFARPVSESGSVGRTFEVASGGRFMYDLALATSADGTLAVAWTDSPDDSKSYAYVRVFEADGAPRTEALRLHSEFHGFRPSLAFLADGRLVVSWTWRTTTFTYRLMARIINRDGQPGELLELDASTSQAAARISPTGRGFSALWGEDVGDRTSFVMRAYDSAATPLGVAAEVVGFDRFDGWPDLDVGRDNDGHLLVLARTSPSSSTGRWYDHPLDYGDAPAPYPTSRSADGARHVAGGLRLGALVDADTGASSDDADYLDDEDGVVFPPFLLRGQEAFVTVNASAAARLDAWIDFDGDGSWESAEQVFARVPLQAGNNSLGFVVPADAVDGPSWSRFRISSTGGLGVTGRATHGEVEDHLASPVLPYVLTVNRSDVAESAGKIFVPIQLSPAQDVPLTVTWSVQSGTATRNVDVAGGLAQVTFQPGQTSKSVPVVVRNDLRDEDTETFHVVLTNPACPQCVQGDGVLRILDDDPMPQVLVQDTGVAEGTALPRVALFKVVVMPLSGRAVQVAYATQAGTAGDGDFTATSGTVTIPAGVSSATVAVPVTPDATDEFDETFTLKLTAATNGILGRTVGTALIRDDDAPPALSMVDASVEEADSGTVAVSVTVNLSVASAKTVTVPWTTGGLTAVAGRDFVATTGTLTFAPGTTSATLTVPVIGDTVDELDERFVVRLLAPINATRLDAQAVITIVDED